MFDKVLLAVDPNHPESWERALPMAIDMVRQSKGELHVAAVVPDFGMTIVRSYFPEGFEPESLRRAKEDLDAFVEAETPKDLKVYAHLGHGDADEQILKIAGNCGADLIVIGAHRHDAMHTFLVGSHADRIVHRSPVSVLVVRPEA